ncbi:hypothetical protein CBS101457_001708 [Exobasidium rhododendri]|nr:hypothetical protein CBS101457_001708 [Exobasidium rhododendri]
MPRSASPDDRHATTSRHGHLDREDERSSGRNERSQSSRHHRDSERERVDRKSRRRRESYSSEEDDEERRERKRKDKRDRKVRETSDERSARKRKKESRSGIGEEEAERRAKAAETLLYSSEANPFNDSSIGTQFRWGKKAEKEKKMGMTPAEAQRRDEERRREAKEEIARLNLKRAEREKEQALREEEESRMARMAESAAMSEWVAKEDDFYLEQSRKRAVIRVRENRAKPIDLLAINLKWVDPTLKNMRDPKEESKGHPIEETEEDDEAELEIDLEEPFLLFDDLDLDETEELHADIQMYLSLEKREHNLEFWRSMIIVCDDKLEELRAEAGEVSQETGIRSRLDASVKAEMNVMLSKQSHKELIALQDQIRQKLRSGEPVDVEYWEGLLKTIVVWRAKAKLSDMHEVIIRNRLEHLRRKQTIEAERRKRLGLPTVEEEREAKAAEANRRKEEREKERAQLDESAVDLYAREAGKDLEEDEDLFNLDEDLANTHSLRNVGSYDWEDKYRPRKPRYFNRVNTGYIWNKYNQSHYDSDNPPPKVVFGYKFNMFYPDLLDKSKSPQYKIVKERGNDETCLILFEAGPPYETIGFRIVNKPWNMSHNRGFKAVFERGVLQLHFQFQRQFYRK